MSPALFKIVWSIGITIANWQKNQQTSSKLTEQFHVMNTHRFTLSKFFKRNEESFPELQILIKAFEFTGPRLKCFNPKNVTSARRCFAATKLTRFSSQTTRPKTFWLRSLSLRLFSHKSRSCHGTSLSSRRCGWREIQFFLIRNHLVGVRFRSQVIVPIQVGKLASEHPRISSWLESITFRRFRLLRMINVD